MRKKQDERVNGTREAGWGEYGRIFFLAPARTVRKDRGHTIRKFHIRKKGG